MTTSSSQIGLAALVGWTLGSVRNGREDFVGLTGYEPIPRHMAAGEPFDSWCAWRKHWEKGLPPQVLATTARRHLRLNEEDSQYGWANLGRGFGSPASGRLDNPIASASSAIVRAMYWGALFQGDSDKAAQYAFYDATLDHSGEGAWVATAFAAGLAKTRLGDDPATVVQNILSSLCPASLLAKAGTLAVRSIGNPEGPREIRRGLPEALALRDPDHAVLTGAWAILGIAHSGGDPGRAALLAAGCGGAAAQAAGAAAMLASAAFGDFPADWVTPLGSEYVSANSTRYLEPPASIEEFMGLTVGGPAPEPQAVVSTPEQEAALEPAEPGAEANSEPEVPALAERPGISLSTMELVAGGGCSTSLVVGHALVTTNYLDGTFATEKRPLRIQIGVRNLSDETEEFELALSAPGGKLASRVATTGLGPGAERLFPAVYEPDPSLDAEPSLSLTVGSKENAIPVIRPTVWMAAGPFDNIEGTGYDTVLAPERGQTANQPFSGRSGVGFTWEPFYTSGMVLAVEPLFKNGAGTAYLFARLVVDPGSYTVMGSIGTGLKLWIDGRQVIGYHDHAIVVHRPAGRNHAEFETEGTFTVLAKVVRGLVPCPELVIAFFDSEGTLRLPKRSLPMG